MIVNKIHAKSEDVVLCQVTKYPSLLLGFRILT